MFGFILASLGTFFEEVSGSIGKKELIKKEESAYSYAFLTTIWGVVLFLFLALVKNELFVFSIGSLPTFSLRLFLEILQVHMTVLGVMRADRSTFNFVRILSVPLLLIIDLSLGYFITTYQIIGILVIVIGLAFVFANKNIQKKGIWFVLFGSINAVFTISLYKYDISHFNSVVAEQLIVYIVLALYFFFIAKVISRENPLHLLKKKLVFTQSFSHGIGSILESFAYSFAPASLILAIKRSSSLLWGIVFGNAYFKEKHILLKLGVFLILATGIVLIVAM